MRITFHPVFATAVIALAVVGCGKDESVGAKQAAAIARSRRPRR